MKENGGGVKFEELVASMDTIKEKEWNNIAIPLQKAITILKHEISKLKSEAT